MFFDLLIQRGIVITNGEVWKRQRQLLSNFFHFEAIKERVPIFHGICNEMIAEILPCSKPDAAKRTFNILQIAQRAAGAMIMKTVLGESICRKKVNGVPLTDVVIDTIN